MKKSSKFKVKSEKFFPIKIKTLFLLFSVFLLLITNNYKLVTVAQANFPVATNLEVADSEAKEGDIISQTSEGLKRSTSPYDRGMVGIVLDSPTIVLHPETDNTKAIISGGDYPVNVTKKNGDIKRGDFITSSSEAGVGQRATQNGYVLGTALEDFPRDGSNGDTGTVRASLNIHYNIVEGSSVGLGALDNFGQGLLNQLSNPGEFVRLSRYVLAALVAIIAILLAFFTFARSVRNGIEAMGRNPLAKASIQRGMVINAFLTSVIALFGLAVAYLIVRFF